MTADPSKYVHTGACFLGAKDKEVHCALEPSHCQGLEFRSSREFPVRSCRGPHKDALGMCTSPIDQYHCTSDPSNCSIQAKFAPNVPYCDLRYNHFDANTPYTLYGLCEPSGGGTQQVAAPTCVWSIDSCPVPDNSYTPASFTTASAVTPLQCTCDQVRTGACRTQEGEWYCAVSAAACSSQEAFVDWQRLQSTHGRQCHLCEPFTKTGVARGGLASGRAWDVRMTRASRVGISLGAIGGVVFGVLISCLYSRWRNRKMGKDVVNGSTSNNAMVKEVELNEMT